MKKISLALGCLVVLGLSSCKKEYTCTCTATVADPIFGLPLPDGSTPVVYTEKIKESEKTEWCDGYESTTQVPSTDLLGNPSTATRTVSCAATES